MSIERTKVIFVDDERLTRDLLKRCLDWEKIGVEIVGEASCAQEAFEVVDKTKPDIIFVDICMPFLDGIEFSKIVVEKYPQMKIIILTGHEEFEYAKKGIKIGIADFLLKPINDEEIKKSVLNLINKIKNEREYYEEHEKLKKQLQDSIPYLKEKFLNEILHSNFNIHEIDNRLKYFNINIFDDFFQISVIDVSHTELNSEENEEKKMLLKMRSRDIISEYFREDHNVNIFFDYSHRIIILSNCGTIDLSDCCEAIKSIIINKFSCYVSIGIGNLYKDIKNIHISYKEACNALDYRIIAGKNQVIRYSDIGFSNENTFRFRSETAEYLNFYIKAGLKEKAEEAIDGFFEEAIAEKQLSLGSIRIIASNIVSVILNTVLELEINFDDILGKSNLLYEKVFKIDTLPEMTVHLKELASCVIGFINGIRAKKVISVVKEVQEYLNNNISDCDISLSEVAKKFFLNSSYLSRVFRQESGQTFVEYLTRIRMEKAAKLLKETDLKAYQVADRIGIKDPHYFGIVFKKFTGMSINDFRNSD